MRVASRVGHVDYASFLACIHSSGRLAIGREFDLASDGLEVALRELDKQTRFDGPAGLPDFDPIAAAWGVARLHAACVLFVHRDYEPDVLTAQLLAEFPASLDAPESHYSVDLALRHLPDIWGLARGVAPGDPLMAAMRRLGAQWPLSSVGLTRLGPVDATPLLANAGLRRLYVDRILQRAGQERAEDPDVAAALEAAIGNHRELARAVLGQPREIQPDLPQ